MTGTACIRSSTLAALAVILLVCAAVAYLKVEHLGVTYSSDYYSYVATAKLFAHAPGATVEGERILKPLLPLTVAALAKFTDYETATLIQALVFYFALAIAMFFLAFEFLEDRLGATYATLFVVLSYPVLRYAIDLNSETGALFLYVLSLLVTLKFLKRPTMPLFLINTALIIVGFLWKEYSAVSGAAFGLAILFHPQLRREAKTVYLGLLVFFFIAVNLPWELFVYEHFHYSYLSWYKSNLTSGLKEQQYTLLTVTKSTAAVLGLAWLVVPFGCRRLSELDPSRKRFSYLSVPPTLLAYFWGYVQSRLLYVVAPPLVLIGYLEVRRWSRPGQAIFTIFVVLANVIWLILSYSVHIT